ncbi:hypothetical protein CP978_18230 [Streptomyces nodosus]|uniref:Uncharacterized protein n=1 Tax=Streptomyces nodosus TaxID=40318 RepID=A0A5P2WG65_9ACTN|nr:hypothetical protein CP978_18230 [Streptomyces nodosus]
MRKRMLRSVLVVAFSAVMAIGALTGLSEEKGDAPADSTWGAIANDVVISGGAASAAPARADDSTWG